MSSGRTPEFEARLAKLGDEPLVSTSGAGRSFSAQMQRIWGYRELLSLLVRRELKTRYKDSALGFAWTLVRPLAMLGVYYIAIGTFLGAARAIPDFAIYLFTGLTLWQLFTDIVGASTGSILANGGLVKKVDLPLEVFPLATVGSALVNFVIQLVVLMGATLAVGRFPLGDRWLYFPVAVGIAVSWGLGLGFILAAVNVYLRDIQYIVEILLTIGFWMCPIAYSWQLVADAIANSPRVADIYLANPMAAAVVGFHQTFWVAGDGIPVPADLEVRLLIVLALGLILTFVGHRIFNRLSGNFAQEL